MKKHVIKTLRKALKPEATKMPITNPITIALSVEALEDAPQK
jgi:hypothetical protein